MDKNIFKALSVEEEHRNCWYEGNYCKLHDIAYQSEEEYEQHPEVTHHYIAFDQITDWGMPCKKLMVAINPDTLCQFTGKVDNNSKCIWEHDIVKVTNTYNNPATVLWYVVRYLPGAGAFAYTDPKELMYCSMADFHDKCIIEVVGNEFDTPELLNNIKSQTPEEYMEEMAEVARKLGIIND